MLNKEPAGNRREYTAKPAKTLKTLTGAAGRTVTGTGRLHKWFPLSQSLSLLVLAVSLFATYQLWKEARDSAEQALQSDFDFLVRESNRRIEQRMLTYEQVLRGTAGLFAASKNVTRRDFHAYVNALRLDENYPGIQGIGFSRLVPAAQRDEHIAGIRNEGFPDYTIKPPGKRDVYSSIVYIEPFSGLNLRAFGYDMYSEPVRRAAMEQARDTGKAALSGKVTLVQEAGQEVQTGFLMYLPVYRNGAPTETLAQRRANLAGWVFAPFRMSDLMSGLIGEQSGNLGIEVYDDREISSRTLMHAAGGNPGINRPDSRFVSTEVIRILGHDWTVVTSALPEFERRVEHDKSPLVLRSGIGASILLALLAWLLIDERARAWKAADQAFRLALYDGLTDLPNRKLFTDRLLHALARAKRDKTQVAVMFIDLDRFKPVNDEFGHAVGDLLLKEVAKRLQQCVRESDTVARLGGDEFVALFPCIRETHGDMMVAEKILKALAEPFHIDGRTLHISSSIGIAIYPEGGSDEKLLLKNADTAMYHAKKSGRNNIKFFHREMDEVRSDTPVSFRRSRRTADSGRND
jgi:diguanylate cyclase (GGDEF)-like protein